MHKRDVRQGGNARRKTIHETDEMGLVLAVRNRIYKHIDHPINLKITAPLDEEEIPVRVRWDDSANTFVDVENPRLALVLLTGNEIPR